MKNQKDNYIYANILANQNKTARTNLVWVADFTEVDILNNKLYIFLCIDIHTNTILSSKISKYQFTTTQVIKEFKGLFATRFPNYPQIKPEISLIIHTDRGTQFSSKKYHEFVNEHKSLFEPSMTGKAKPKENPVMERMNKTFKNHKKGNLTFEETLLGEFMNDPDFKGYARLFHRFINSINNKANKKTKPESPLNKDKKLACVNEFMLSPVYPKAFSPHIIKDYRLESVEFYKTSANDLCDIIDEYISRKAEVVDSTPFDSPNKSENRDLRPFLDQLTKAINQNSTIVKAHVDESLKEALKPVNNILEDIQKDIQTLLPKKKKQREIRPLRDPLDAELFPIFLKNAGKKMKRLKELKSSQLRVCYTLLFYTGLRINEASVITHQDLQDAFITCQITVTHFKQKQSHNHILSHRALRDLRAREEDIEFIFVKNKYRFLFGKELPIHEKALIRFVNQDLQYTCHTQKIPYNIKSHSFRIYVIASLLKLTSVQNVADVIGHNDIRSTLKYARYALNKQEIQKLFDKLPDIPDIPDIKPDIKLID